MTALPIRKLEEALLVRQVKPHWYIGTSVIGDKRCAFFARTRGELHFRYRDAQLQHLRKTLFPTQRVRLRPAAGLPCAGGTIYQIAMVGTQGDGTPVAWLQGRPGCIPLDRLAPVSNVEDLPA
jgi:hypothetical protein